MDLGGVGGALSIVGAILTVLILAGVAAALVRGSYNKASIEALRTDNNDLRERLDDRDEKLKEKDQTFENEIKLRDLRETQLEERCDHLESENKTLMEMVTQRAEVAAVAGRLEDHHTEVMRKYSVMIRLLAKMARADGADLNEESDDAADK